MNVTLRRPLSSCPLSVSGLGQTCALLWVPGLYGLYWGAGPLGCPNPRVILYFSFVVPILHPCSETKLLPEKNSLLSLLRCNSAFSTFIPSFLCPEEVQQKFLLSTCSGTLRQEIFKEEFPPPHCSYSTPRGTKAAIPISGTELHAIVGKFQGPLLLVLRAHLWSWSFWQKGKW